MNVISILIGIIAAIIMVPGIVPLLGWLLWLVVLLCVVGIIFGAVSKKKSGLFICGAVLVVSLLRLFLGGGIF
jgi:hypothetical protein